MKKAILLLTLFGILILVGCKTPYQQLQEQGNLNVEEIKEVEKSEITTKQESKCIFKNTLICKVLELGTGEVTLEIYNEGGEDLKEVFLSICSGRNEDIIKTKEKKVYNFKKCNFGKVGEFITKDISVSHKVPTKWGHTTNIIYGNLSGTITSESIPQQYFFLSSNPRLIKGGSDYNNHFEIDNNTYSILSKNQYKITFSLGTLSLLEPISIKLYLNEDMYEFDTENAYFDVSNSIKSGINKIKITPDKDIRVTALEISGDII